MYSILVVLATLAVALPLATAQFMGQCYVNMCGLGGTDPLADDLVPPGVRVREMVPYEFCDGFPVIGITTVVCVADVTPLVLCDGPESIIITRMGMPAAPATISMSVSCQYPLNWIPPLSYKSNKDLKPKAKKLS